MKLYIDTKKMIFDEDDVEKEVITKVKNVKFLHYDYVIELPDDDIFIQNNYHKDDNSFHIREENTWWSFPLYQIVDGKIISFDYTKYQYFADTDRRMALAKKINKLYNPASEAKLARKTLKKILDHLEMKDDKFEKYNTKIEQIIIHNPKEK